MKNNSVSLRMLFKYFFIFYFLFFISSVEVFSQDEKKDVCDNALNLYRSTNYKSQPDKCIPIYINVLKITENVGCWDVHVYALNALAAANFNKKKYGQSKLYAQKAVEISKQYLGETSEEYAISLFNLNYSFEEIGDFNRSISGQKQAVRIYEENRENDPNFALMLEGIGMSYKKLGDVDLAIPYFERAMKLFDEAIGFHSLDVAAALMLLASCYKAKNDLPTSLEYYNRSLPIFEKLNKSQYNETIRWDVLREMADVYYSIGDKEKAFYFMNQALDIQSKYDLIGEYKASLIFGNIYLNEGEYEKAQKLFEEANIKAVKEYKMYSRKMELAMPVLGMANLFAKKGGHEKAMGLYKKALELITFDFIADDVFVNPPTDQFMNKLEALQILEGKAELLTNLYKIKNEQKLLLTANETWLLAADLIQEIRQSYLEQGSKHNLIDKVNTIYGKAVETAVELHRISGKEKYLEDAFFFAESNRAVLFYESYKNEMAKKLAGIPDILLEKEKSLLAEINFYEKNILEDKQLKTADSTDLTAEWKEKVFDLKNEYQAHVKLLEESYPVYLESKQQTNPLSLNKLRQKLSNSKTAVIEFMLTQETGFVFFITNDELFIHEIDKDFLLQKNIAQLREVLISPPQSNEQIKEDYLAYTDAAVGLYQNLLEEGLVKIGKKINQLIFVPDGALNYIPLELLVVKNPMEKNYFFNELKYLFANYKVSYSYSATLINSDISKSKKEGGSTRFVGFAPAFGEDRIATTRECIENVLYGLQCSESEVRGINEVWDGNLFMNVNASVQAFKNASNTADIVHLATHACLDEKEPTLNKIYFTGGSLTQHELNGLKLNTKLTVLSACNTGSGKIQKGEGVMSLARSFILAGSKSVLTSLWSVDDCATSEIMVNYYTCLKNGMPKDAAIAEAKKTYLDSADVNNSHPYYWGAFVQFGDVEALESPGFNYWYLLVGAVLIVGLFLSLKNRQKAVT